MDNSTVTIRCADGIFPQREMTDDLAHCKTRCGSIDLILSPKIILILGVSS